MTIQELVEALKKHALENYEKGGWDVIVECYSDEEIAVDLRDAKATTLEEAIAAFKDLVDVWADRQADADSYREVDNGELDYERDFQDPGDVWEGFERPDGLTD